MVFYNDTLIYIKVKYVKEGDTLVNIQSRDENQKNIFSVKELNLDGVMLLQGTLKDGNQIGSYYWYYDTGELFIYEYYNSEFKSVFMIVYNKEGEIEGVKGSGLVSISRDSDIIKCNDKYIAEIEMVNPPDFFIDLYVQIDSNSKKLDLEKVGENNYLFEKRFSKRGEYDIKLFWYIKDTIRNYNRLYYEPWSITVN
jgi:hypothetical protein